MDSMSAFDTAIIIYDMNEGNRRPEFDEVIEEMQNIIDNKFKFCLKVFFVDNHNKESKEVKLCGDHCTKRGDKNVVSELLKYGDMRVFEKNCKNGMFAPNFPTWFFRNLHINNYIIMGYQFDEFARSLMSYICQEGIETNLIVDERCVVDSGLKEAELELMRRSGIKVGRLVE